MRRFGIILFSLLAGVLGFVVLALAVGFFSVRASLPPLSGERTVDGLEAEVVVERDSLGVPAIRASSVQDAIFGQGFVHGQDRFFQMDLLRRLVAGELAELVGEPAVASDRRYRPYGYRRAAERHLDHLDPDDREVLEAYVRGVNAGLASLGRRPPEYVVMRSTPEPWEAVDTILGFLYFYIGLSTHYRDERHLRDLYSALPQELADFLTPDASRFDAPVMATDDDPSGGYRPLPIPGPGVVDLRDPDQAGALRAPAPSEAVAIRSSHHPLHPGSDPFEPFEDRQALLADPRQPGGSNSWAIRGEDGRTLLANDPHLELTVPGIWYRVQLIWDDRRIVGVSPPGLPGVFAGMSRELAWGVTAALVDQTDLVEIELDPDEPMRYRVPGGWDSLTVREEVLRVRAGETRSQEVRETRWGPILFEGHDGVPLALRSPAYDPGGVTMRFLVTLEARSLEELIQLTREVGGPGLSMLMADNQGRIGWGVSGVLPQRRGFSGKRPVSFATPGVGWDGVRDESDRPTLILEEPGTLHTANQRLLDLPDARRLSHMWMPPFRARRIADRLDEGIGTDIDSSHSFQLDTRSLLHEPLRDLALDVLSGDDLDPRLDSLRTYLVEWDGTADPEHPHFRIMVRVGTQMINAVIARLVEPVSREIPDFQYSWHLSHEPALRILEERPDHLLPGGFPDWDSFLRVQLLVAHELLARGRDGLDTPWGEANRARFEHPLGQISPALGRFLNLPQDPLPGWSGTVRAQTPTYGQSFRMVARPGDFDSATFQMPGGQSGHPFSRHYRAGHRAWLGGNPAGLAPGPPRNTLVLRPAEG